jgi:regulator of nonsense transcripts 1
LWHHLLQHFKDRNCLVEGPLTNLQVSLLQFSRPKQTYRGPQRYQMAFQHANNMTAARPGWNNGGKPRQEYTDNGSIVGYIPDDVSSVHSSALGGVNVTHTYPPMFSGFQESWPLPGRSNLGPKGKGNGVAGSVAGESVAASELTDTRSSIADGPGGISLSGLNLNDYNKPTSLSQSDRLNRFVESTRRTDNAGANFGGNRGLRSGLGGYDDDDARSISTAFASQMGYND